jgi:hypothetical protein
VHAFLSKTRRNCDQANYCGKNSFHDSKTANYYFTPITLTGCFEIK